MVDDIRDAKRKEARKRFQRMAEELSHLREADPALHAEAVKVLEPRLHP